MDWLALKQGQKFGMLADVSDMHVEEMDEMDEFVQRGHIQNFMLQHIFSSFFFGHADRVGELVTPFGECVAIGKMDGVCS